MPPNATLNLFQPFHIVSTAAHFQTQLEQQQQQSKHILPTGCFYLTRLNNPSSLFHFDSY